MGLADLFNDLHDADDTKQVEVPDIGKVARRFWKRLPERELEAATKIRASGAYYLCPREFVLQYWQPRPRPRIEIGNKLMMNCGTTIHDVLQNQVLGSTLCLRGWWKNLESGEKKEGYHPDPEATWDELLKELRDIPAGNEALLEMKSAGSWAANNIVQRGIGESYQCQASVYQWLSGIHRTLFLYIDRDSMKFLPAIDYQIDWGWVKTVKRKARIIWEAIRDETLPDSAMVCSTPTDSRAKDCPHSQACFAHLRTSPKITPANFKAYVAKGKAEGAKNGRNFIDLSKWEP